MSASHKKQLRREENQTAMTERQKQEMKEAKKLRIYTIAFVAILVLVLAIAIAATIFNSGIIERNTTALKVNSDKISAAELNYYYIDSVNKYMNSYGAYASIMGLDSTLALDEQYFDEEAGQTWADYMLDMAVENAKYAYALYQDANANGFTLSETTQLDLETSMNNLSSYASLYGYSSADSYLEAMYGNGSNLESYEQYMTIQAIANEYYNTTVDNTVYTDEELHAAEAENYNAYSSYSYNYYYVAANKYYEGGTTNDDGTLTYSDEEIAAGVEKAKKVANALAGLETLENLDAGIATLDVNADVEGAATTAVVDRLYTSVETAMQEWITAEDRKEGDITTIENKTTTTDADGNEVETVSGYYVVYYVGSNDNTFPLVNVRHILLQHEGGTTDESTGTTTYTDEEKAATLAKAEELLATFTAGEATEEAFATLASENSQDTGSITTGGLYEDVYPGQMVSSFNDWCFDASRQPGDTGIVESDYGYHIMYFSSNSETTYRDYMITNELLNTDITEWQNGIVDAATAEIVNDNYVKKSLMVNLSE